MAADEEREIEESNEAWLEKSRERAETTAEEARAEAAATDVGMMNIAPAGGTFQEPATIVSGGEGRCRFA